MQQKLYSKDILKKKEKKEIHNTTIEKNNPENIWREKKEKKIPIEKKTLNRNY